MVNNSHPIYAHSHRLFQNIDKCWFCEQKSTKNEHSTKKSSKKTSVILRIKSAQLGLNLGKNVRFVSNETFFQKSTKTNL